MALWIFAYGSLVFRPAFDFVERRRAFVQGYARRFWQASPDHRGTEGFPGRVATLVPLADALCGGCAYRLDEAWAEPILAAIDHREKAGFDRRIVPMLDGPGGATFAEGLTWIADRTNVHFFEEASETVIAEVVRMRHGPSGPNSAYVLELRDALRALEVFDPHVEAIADHLRT